MTSRIALAAALLLVLGSIPAGARAAGKGGAKVLVVGVDAGEWDVLGPLMDQGRCPNFARMRAQGSAGKLRSLLPLARSPVIWASIATGKVPEKHGIQDFFMRMKGIDTESGDEVPADRRRPQNSTVWQARPIWKILGGLGRTVGVVGWWTTWPAQPVNGTLVTDYVQYSHSKWPTSGSRRTYPESLSTMVERLRRRPESVSWAEVFQFVPAFDTTRTTERRQAIVHDLKWIYAADVTFYRVALELYRAKHPDFFTVYLRGVDEMSHLYWDPDTYNEHHDEPLTAAEKAWLKPLIPNYYAFTDRLLGEFLKEAGKNTDVIVCSDHGFGGGGQGVMAHKPDGIVFMMGPHVVKGGTITGATVLDIAPSILALFGLPTARDMDGRPIAGGLQPALVKRMERETRLQTYETGRAEGPSSEEPLRSPVDDELRERLRSLGYIQ
ncbi:MAG TPA: alkaline phosphatase family protein [Candidatus Saccharimonadales bacterium]|nr:alkaline phosphatase family protein [Candidatus Saccharimonadales bacterium]